MPDEDADDSDSLNGRLGLVKNDRNVGFVTDWRVSEGTEDAQLKPGAVVKVQLDCVEPESSLEP